MTKLLLALLLSWAAVACDAQESVVQPIDVEYGTAEYYVGTGEPNVTPRHILEFMPKGSISVRCVLASGIGIACYETGEEQ